MIFCLNWLQKCLTDFEVFNEFSREFQSWGPRVRTELSENVFLFWGTILGYV